MLNKPKIIRQLPIMVQRHMSTRGRIVVRRLPVHKFELLVFSDVVHYATALAGWGGELGGGVDGTAWRKCRGYLALHGVAEDARHVGPDVDERNLEKEKCP